MLVCITALQLYITGINMKALHFVITSHSNPTMNAFVINIGVILYFVLTTFSLIYMTSVGFTYAINYRYLHREPRNGLKWYNIAVGFVWIIATFYAWNNQSIALFPAYCRYVVTFNTAFIYFVIISGCIKRGFDYNMKRMHRPAWELGNIFSN